MNTILNNGVTMPLLGLGLYDVYGKEAEQTVHWGLETGYRLLDTATVYQNETEIGNALKDCNLPRQELFLTTKVWQTDMGFDNTLRAFDTSLNKLQTDYVDLYLVHWPVRQFRKETWLALEQLYAQRRVRAIGVANYLIPFLEELLAYASVIPAVNQVELSPYLYLKDLHQLCQQQNIQLQAYTPLVRGQRFNDPKLVALATKYGKTPAQVMLRWFLEHGISTIPKSSNLKRLQENFNIFDFQLSTNDLALMDSFNEDLRVVEDPMDLW